MKEFKPIKEGKVREVYDNGDSLIISATDRISAFDVILKNEVKDRQKKEAGVSGRVHSTEPHDFNRCERYAGILPE